VAAKQHTNIATAPTSPLHTINSTIPNSSPVIGPVLKYRPSVRCGCRAVYLGVTIVFSLRLGSLFWRCDRTDCAARIADPDQLGRGLIFFRFCRALVCINLQEQLILRCCIVSGWLRWGIRCA
jgi:hypothetical protein